MNSEQFYITIAKLEESFENRDLETYLLALYQNILEHKDEELTYELVIDIISKSFTSKAAKFNIEWLDSIEAPDENRMSQKFTNKAFSDFVDKSNHSTLAPFEFTIDVLKFQIAELHKMKGKQLEDEYRYFGIDSETGHRWYNFDPFAILSCGSRCMEDNERDFTNLDWSFIGELLENGRIYVCVRATTSCGKLKKDLALH